MKNYEMLVKTGEQYSADGEWADILVNELSTTSEQLLLSVNNLLRTIDEINTAAMEGADGTSSIAERTSSISVRANDVLAQANEAKKSAEKLVWLVIKFQVSE